MAVDKPHKRVEASRFGSLYNIADLAALLSVPETWVRDKVTEHAIPHTRIGKHVRFTDDHVREIIERGYQPARRARSRRASKR